MPWHRPCWQSCAHLNRREGSLCRTSSTSGAWRARSVAAFLRDEQVAGDPGARRQPWRRVGRRRDRRDPLAHRVAPIVLARGELGLTRAAGRGRQTGFTSVSMTTELRVARAALDDINDELARWGAMDPSNLPAATADRQRTLHAQQEQLRHHITIMRGPNEHLRGPETRNLLAGTASLVGSLATATDDQRRDVYAALGVRLTYDAISGAVAGSLEPLGVLPDSDGRIATTRRRASAPRYKFEFNLPRAKGARRGSAEGSKGARDA